MAKKHDKESGQTSGQPQKPDKPETKAKTPQSAPEAEELAQIKTLASSSSAIFSAARKEAVPVRLERSQTFPTDDQAFWADIRSITRATGFNHYQSFIHKVLCADTPHYRGKREDSEKYLRKELESLQHLDKHLHGLNAYNLLKTATECFLLLNCGLFDMQKRFPGSNKFVLPHEDLMDELAESRRFHSPTDMDEIRGMLENYLKNALGEQTFVLPYLQRIVTTVFDTELDNFTDSPFCTGLLSKKINADTAPCLIELIWSYWHEQGMLVQTLAAISRRFQNKRAPGARDPLANLEIAPLRPINNMLWGYIEEERHRLSLPRRAYEYDHHYGLKLVGKAVPKLRSADTRSKFIESFHNLLLRSMQFYREDDDTTVIADGFALLNAIKEVHIILTQGMHNQYGDLPWTARVEMLIMQWLMARPETVGFLRGRAMVPYKEEWMGQVDTMKTLQGWTDVNVTHFRDLGVFGEQLLLSLRFGDWIGIEDQEHAKNWARYWRQEIQGYIHAYRAVTGVDLSTDITGNRNEKDRFTQPSTLLKKRETKKELEFAY